MEDFKKLMTKIGSSAAASAVTDTSKQLLAAAIEAAAKWPGPSAALLAAAVGGSVFAVVSFLLLHLFLAHSLTNSPSSPSSSFTSRLYTGFICF